MTIFDWPIGVVIGALTALWDLLAATAFTSLDVTVLPQVTSFAGTSLDIVNTCYVLAILTVAVLVMGRDTIQTTYGPGELIPRLIVGLIAANLALPLCSTLIALANSVTAAITEQSITSPDSMSHLRNLTTAALDGQGVVSPAGVLLIVIGLIIAVLVATLMVQWIIRLGTLIILVGISPIALALHATPQTEGAALLWWRSMLGVLGTVTAQAVALHTALRIFLSPGSNLAPLGLPGDPSAVMNLLIVMCLLLGVVKIPKLVGRYVTRSRSGGAGTVVRLLVTRQITRSVFGRAGGARASRPVAAAGTTGWPVR